MRRIETIRKIADLGIVAVVRTESKEQGIKIVDAIKNGGIKAIEITMTVPGALDIINEISETYKNEDILIGAGTVLDPESARACMLAGAQYIISPNLNIETLKICNRYRIPSFPGVMTVKEALEAMEYGAEILKLFPGSAFGPSIIKAFKGPLPYANFMPTGGVDIDNVKDWFEAGAVAIATGSNLTKGAKSGNYELVTETAKKFVEEVAKYKK
ncbi:bifunctional 4-hydroxy-2-oxoglutarate aldolase/2-dehydro-3-deoxy-phosphogluconate aldolase [Lutispora saccharofermentans]|uniref:Bifunctional 4-hydroxy-2-oxoglutarate aldolase/2-dehydro-3-deoxy-phosphogluconate aldolase n=1 Tax=Lutispora saccharofermentans TaxID=3024236 RepID=A0ABT1NHQ7_9FIRM|nr:bifunctional 4-hydroxy-2-oxoglutarate aldolase/2-dehydro-3-deoxy-phosphogluconate aldolase [Lutispora saccharofermentans]MCQ1529396.1 bifunctional 4-hydroxy-2-oxoglutarate aldolase/2-dehydro-3-deoxy-phosphogluconate aldolase [Lutispora saccharofermentans]